MDIVVGGSFGYVSVRVQTSGGGETVDDFIDLLPALSNNDTIGGVLSSRSTMRQAVFGVDYIQLDTILNFSVSKYWLTSLCLLVVLIFIRSMFLC